MATQATLETLFGGQAAAKVLLFIENYGEGYANWIAKTFEMPVSEIQKQLPALDGLRQMLRSTLEYGIPKDRLQKYYRQRRRPRRKGKPL
jgi:hypothetical protein